jgi:hypothetical protein
VGKKIVRTAVMAVAVLAAALFPARGVAQRAEPAPLPAVAPSSLTIAQSVARRGTWRRAPTLPAFVIVNGKRMGRDAQREWTSCDLARIVSLTILSGARAVEAYGSEAEGGAVIVARMRRPGPTDPQSCAPAFNSRCGCWGLECWDDSTTGAWEP